MAATTQSMFLTHMDNQSTPFNWLDSIKVTALRLRYRLGLSPSQAILRRIKRYGIDVKPMTALEVFGGNGSRFTREIASCVARFEAWEIDPVAAQQLQHNFPHAKILVTDSIREAKRAEGQFGLISIDNPMSIFGTRYCEHFDLFPDILRLGAPQSIFVVTFISCLTTRAKRRFPYLFNTEHLARRATFYETDSPEDVKPEFAMRAYEKLARQIG